MLQDFYTADAGAGIFDTQHDNYFTAVAVRIDCVDIAVGLAVCFRTFDSDDMLSCCRFISELTGVWQYLLITFADSVCFAGFDQRCCLVVGSTNAGCGNTADNEQDSRQPQNIFTHGGHLLRRGR